MGNDFGIVKGSEDQAWAIANYFSNATETINSLVNIFKTSAEQAQKLDLTEAMNEQVVDFINEVTPLLESATGPTEVLGTNLANQLRANEQFDSNEVKGAIFRN